MGVSFIPILVCFGGARLPNTQEAPPATSVITSGGAAILELPTSAPEVRMARTAFSRLLAVGAALTIAVTALAVSAPAQAAPAKPKVTATITELPAQIRLIPGESVSVRLSTNLTTGYTWSTKVVGKKASVSVGKGVYVAPSTDMVGAPGTTTWLVTAQKKGTAVVKFLTSPPGEDTTKVEGSLTVIVG